jgi:hypothetical protein
MDLTIASPNVMFVVNSRVYMPANYARGTVTSGTSTITGCASDDNNSTNVTTDIVAGSILLDDPTENRLFATSSTDHVVLTNSGGTITLNGASMLKSGTIQLGPFCLPAASNTT